MPIHIGDHHLPDDLLEIFVGCLDYLIHFGPVRRRIEMLNLLLSAELIN
jgi:hypothetical protein